MFLSLYSNEPKRFRPAALTRQLIPPMCSCGSVSPFAQWSWPEFRVLAFGLTAELSVQALSAGRSHCGEIIINNCVVQSDTLPVCLRALLFLRAHASMPPRATSASSLTVDFSADDARVEKDGQRLHPPPIDAGLPARRTPPATLLAEPHWYPLSLICRRRCASERLPGTPTTLYCFLSLQTSPTKR